MTIAVTPVLLAWSGGSTWPIALYLSACALLTAGAAALAPETARRLLPG